MSDCQLQHCNSQVSSRQPKTVEWTRSSLKSQPLKLKLEVLRYQPPLHCVTGVGRGWNRACLVHLGPADTGDVAGPQERERQAARAGASADQSRDGGLGEGSRRQLKFLGFVPSIFRYITYWRSIRSCFWFIQFCISREAFLSVP